MGATNLLTRKVWWREGNRATINFGTHAHSSWTHLHWEKARLFGVVPDTYVFQLYWDGEYSCDYEKEYEIKVTILQMAYDIKPELRIPSELLYDAGLSYLNPNHWVDEFGSPADEDINYGICATLSCITPPVDRRIRLAPVTNGVRKIIDKVASKKERKFKKKKQPLVLPPSVGSIKTDSSRYWDPEAARSSSIIVPDWWQENKPRSKTVYTKPKVRGVPDRPTDSNFSPVKMDWEDFSLESRPWKSGCDLPDSKQPDDNDCVYVFAPAEKMEVGSS